jgi:hypothetical protein
MNVCVPNEPDSESSPFASELPNPVIEWNRTLLLIVRTPGAESPTIHSTRNFAILHVAMYDAVNNIDGRFSPYDPAISKLASESFGLPFAQGFHHF